MPCKRAKQSTIALYFRSTIGGMPPGCQRRVGIGGIESRSRATNPESKSVPVSAAASTEGWIIPAMHTAARSTSSGGAVRRSTRSELARCSGSQREASPAARPFAAYRPKEPSQAAISSQASSSPRGLAAIMAASPSSVTSLVM